LRLVGEAQPAGGQVPAAEVTARRFRVVSPVTAATLAGLAVLLIASLLGTALAEGRGLTTRGLLAGGGLVLMLATVAAVGLVVASHQPGNPIGWLLLGSSLCFLLTFNAGAYDTLIYHLQHRGLPLGPEVLLLQPLGNVALVLFPLVILLFPDGRLPSRRWAWLLWPCLALVGAYLVSVGAVTVGAIAGHHVSVLPDGNLASVEHPAGSTSWLSGPQLGSLAAVAVLWVGAIGHQIASWRHASGERRQQLKWLMSGAAVAAVAGGSSVLTDSVLWEVAALGFAALPVSIGIGILKYRLYDIDRIISRTLAYAIVTGLLVGVYAGLVLLVTQALPVSLSTPVAVACATLVAAALFNPLRRRVQRLVDRRFNRARYNADKTVAAFAARLQDAVDLDAVHDDLAGVVHQALEPAHVSVWISQRG
jgi:hypothetical protein